MKIQVKHEAMPTYTKASAAADNCCHTNAMPDCDVLFVDLTRQEFGVPAVKVIVTGDIQRLSEPLVTVSKRLYEFPEKMAYTNKRFSYKELYLGPYQH